MIGEQLEELGWRQGSIVNRSDIPGLFTFIGKNQETGVFLIVATQSYDIANNNIAIDPNIELIVARPIDQRNGSLAFNKNPRQLHTELKIFTGNGDLFSYQNIEIKIAERILVPKEYLANLTPEDSVQLETDQLESCVNWLSARYSRPALPTVFNDRISKADPKGKLREKEYA